MPIHNVDLNTGEAQNIEPQQSADSTRQIPVELRNAKVSSGSAWKTAGRVAIGILTLSLSELLPLAWRGIKFVAGKIMKAVSREPRTQNVTKNALPPALPEADSFNENAALRLLSGSALPDSLENAAQDAIRTLRKTFGSELVPEGQKLKTLLGSGVQTVRQNILDQKDEVSPAQIREWVLQEGKSCAVTRALANKLKECWPKEAGKMSVYMPEYLLARCPELKSSLEACENPEEISKTLGQHEAEITSFIQLKQQLDDLCRQAKITFAGDLFRGLGLNGVPMSDFQCKSFNKKAEKLASDILAGKHPGCLEQGFDPAGAFDALAREEAGTRVQEYKSIEGMPSLSDELKNAFKHLVITRDKVTPGELKNYAELGSKVDASPLMALLSEPNPDMEAIREEMLRLGEKLDNVIQERYGAENWVNMEPEDKEAIQAYSSQVMLDAVPGLRRAFAELPQLRELSDWCQEQMFSEAHPLYGVRMPNVAGIARLMVNSTGEIDIRVDELRKMQGNPVQL